MDYRSGNNTVYSAKYHMMWCPKYRRRVLAGGVDERRKEILAHVAVQVGVIPPVVAWSGLVGLAKGRSSRLLRREFPPLRRLACWWSPLWFVSTVGGAPPEVVGGYAEQQKGAG